ncbi:hypothetical protein K6Y31_17945 [Motilimonas cestriensis]|uniref:Uncharacterized protein n=1 Tax=Motilimonas cestriensis TaxID=2742685 RepID=A0ABS8WGF1_9GAMM|nr:hypothetical protein [Motilimonas cestriensis]MCE2596674.1 hypothetical protein [Motilimonas cestriensis]
MFSESDKHETYRVLGLAAMCSGGGEYKVDWAMYLLESGVETENLAILATLLKPVNEFEAEDYFNRVLNELKIIRPSQEAALAGYAWVLAKDIIDGVLAPDSGVSQIYAVNMALDYPGTLGEFTALEDEWYCECINGLSKQKRREEIIKACNECLEVLQYPDVFKA